MASIKNIKKAVGQQDVSVVVPIYDKQDEPYLAADGTPSTISVVGDESTKYRAAVAARNLHPVDDYKARNREIFAAFGLDFAAVRLARGTSDDPAVLAQFAGRAFELIYIDGDHSFEVVSSDIAHFAPLVVPGGFMVMDDAACELPGEGFWKGVAEVSRAARAIPALGFDNPLNVGHNRLYRRRE